MKLIFMTLCKVGLFGLKALLLCKIKSFTTKLMTRLTETERKKVPNSKMKIKQKKKTKGDSIERRKAERWKTIWIIYWLSIFQ